MSGKSFIQSAGSIGWIYFILLQIAIIGVFIDAFIYSKTFLAIIIAIIFQVSFIILISAKILAKIKK